MADEQPNSHPSPLNEEDLNKLEEAVSENNACRSSSMQSGEVNVSVCRGRASSGNYAKLPIHNLYN